MILWHADRDLQGVDAVIVPGGFSYGDYLRVGAIARFAPVMEEVAEFARDGGLVLGICNGFQVLCEAGLLPGALLPNLSLRFVCRQVTLDVVDPDTPFTARASPAAAVDPGQAHDRPLLLARAGPRRCSATRRREPERLPGRHRRRVQRGGQRVRADAAPRARRRPADGLDRRADGSSSRSERMSRGHALV